MCMLVHLPPDPKTNVSRGRVVNNTRHDMFCAGHSLLPDGTSALSARDCCGRCTRMRMRAHVAGRLLIAGGEVPAPQRTTIYDPFNDSYIAVGTLNIPRAYNGNVQQRHGGFREDGQT